MPWLNPLAAGPSPAVQPWLIAAVCAVLVWIAAGLPRTPRLAAGALTMFGLWILLRTREVTPEVVFGWGALCVIGIGAAIGAKAGQCRRLLQLAVLAWVLAAVASAIIAITQYFGLVHWLAPFANIAETGEAFGNLRQRNQFATMTAIGLLAVLWLVRSGRLAGSAAGAVVVLLAAADAASASRTAAVQLSLVLAAVIWWQGNQKALVVRLCCAAALAYLAAALALPIALETFTGHVGGSLFRRIGHSVTCDSRLILWSNVMELTLQRPLLGWGWGELDYAHFMWPYQGPRFCDILDNAHNLPLQLAVELGIPFAVLAIGGACMAVARGQPWRELNPDRQLAWGALAVVLVHSLVEYPLWYAPFQLAFGIACGVLLSRPPIENQVPAGAAAGVAFLILSALGYALWDYSRVSQIYTPPAQRSSWFHDDPVQAAARSWLFRNQAKFAQLSMGLPAADAAATHELAGALLHYSPEARVAERLVESSVLLGREDEAVVYLARFRAAFPSDYEDWRRRTTGDQVAPKR